jgi:hypothetical protein
MFAHPRVETAAPSVFSLKSVFDFPGPDSRIQATPRNDRSHGQNLRAVTPRTVSHSRASIAIRDKMTHFTVPPKSAGFALSFLGFEEINGLGLPYTPIGILARNMHA